MSISTYTYVSTANSFHQKTAQQPPSVAVELGCRLLESWTKNFPALGDAYRSKEDFFAIYDAMTMPEAKAAYATWEKISSAISEAFKPLVTVIGNCETEIMNYFDHPVSNAYTESLNSLIQSWRTEWSRIFF